MSNNTGVRTLGPQKVLRAAIDSSAASIAAVAAVTGKRINILGLCLGSDGADTVVFSSGSTELGQVVFKATDPHLVLPISPDAWFECAPGEAFNIGNAGTGALTGFVVYMVVG